MKITLNDFEDNLDLDDDQLFHVLSDALEMVGCRFSSLDIEREIETSGTKIITKLPGVLSKCANNETHRDKRL